MWYIFIYIILNLSFKKFQSGVGLIEILVALLVLTTSLMALALLQTRSLQYNHNSYLESQSNIYAYDIIDRIRVNAANNSSSSTLYANTLTAYTVAKGGSASTTNAVATADIADWKNNITNNLPGGTGEINCVAATKICTIKIYWTDLSASSSTNATPEMYFQYVAML